MSRTRHDQDGASPLNLVLGRQEGRWISFSFGREDQFLSGASGGNAWHSWFF